MNKEKRKVPKLRFPDCNRLWEEYRLADLLVERSVLCTQSEKYPLVSFTVESGVTPKTERYDREALVVGNKASKKYKMTLVDDIVYNPANLKFGAIARNKYGNAVFSPIYVTLEVQTNRVFPKFIEYILTSKCFINRALRYQQGTVYERQSVNVESLLLQTVNIPVKDEQIKISDLLYKFDQLLGLYQHKLKMLLLKKKALLQKLFPKAGARYPELRFPGFTDAWEQRKLGDVFEEYSEKNHPDLPPLTIIQGGGTIRRDESERALQYDKASLFNYKMVNVDDFIVHLRSFEGGLEKANSKGIISPAYHTFHGENIDSRFYYAYFHSKEFINKDLKPHVYGIRDGRSIDIEGMKTIRIPYTSYKEQRTIGDFLEHLDHLITLHQRKSHSPSPKSLFSRPNTRKKEAKNDDVSTRIRF